MEEGLAGDVGKDAGGLGSGMGDVRELRLQYSFSNIGRMLSGRRGSSRASL